MAVITSVSIKTVGYQALTPTTLSAADTFTYDPAKRQVMLFVNQTAGSLTAVIKGDGATGTILIDGIGSVNLAAGYSVTVPANGTGSLVLPSIRQFLTGTGVVNVTGAATLRVFLIEP